MKRHLSHFISRLSLSLAGIVSVFLVGCTLYMDDPDDLRVLRTEEGYLEEEVIELPNGNGTISYKYNQKTIAITDEVEEYVVKVESDSIVYFVSSIPDYYLPEAGEMMTCSFREKFPDGFCHRCIERSEVNGLYRCVFTKCSLAEAFDKLKINHVQPTAVNVNGEDYELTTEQFDSIMGDNYSPEVMEARTRSGDSEERVPFTQTKVEFLRVECAGKKGNNNADFTGKGTFGGDLVIRGYADVDCDSEKGTMKTTFDCDGSLNLWFEVEGAANITLCAPDDIKIKGLSFDWIVVGLKAGLFCKPYITISSKVSGKINVGWKFRFTTTCNQPGFNVETLFTAKNRQCSSPEVTFTGDASALNLEAGVEIYLKFGADLFEIGGETSAGVKLYGAVDLPLDLTKYSSAEAFKQEHETFPLYLVLYLKGTRKLKHYEAEIGMSLPIKLADLPIPILPEIDKSDGVTTFYCKDEEKKIYCVKYKLSSTGLFGFYFNFAPYARIFDTSGHLLTEFQLAPTTYLEWETTWTDKNGIIQVNTPYIVQISLYSYDKNCWYSLRDINFEIEKVDCKISYAEIVKSFDAVLLGYKYFRPTFSNIPFRYEYIIDVQMQIDRPKSVGLWGFLMQRTDDGAPFYFEQTVKSDWRQLTVAYPTVRFYFYTNKEYDFNRKPVDIYVKFAGRYSHISNWRAMKFIGNSNGEVCLQLAYENATGHGPFTDQEKKEFESYPFGFDMLKDNQATNNNFLYETHKQTFFSRSTPLWSDMDDDDVYVVCEER